jgi:hypothetical protein
MSEVTRLLNAIAKGDPHLAGESWLTYAPVRPQDDELVGTPTRGLSTGKWTAVVDLTRDHEATHDSVLMGRLQGGAFR